MNFDLGVAYLEKYKALDEKPNYLIDNELLSNSKREFKIEVSKNPDVVLRETNINLGVIYNKIGRTIDALDYFETVLDTYEKSVFALYNKGNALLTYSSFTDNPTLLIKEAYYCFKIVLMNENLPNIMKNNCEKYISSLLEKYCEDFLETDNNEICEIQMETNFESFMIEFCLENKLFINLCNFCQLCPNAVGDTIIIEKMMCEVKPNIKDDLFLNLSSYLNQLKMDYVSARFLLILSKYNECNLDIIMKHVLIVDTKFLEENDIQVQLLKDSFKNFFNILDKISVFIKRYLELDIPLSKVTFRNMWFEYDKETKVINNKINPKLASMKNYGLTALYDIYLDVEYGKNEKEYLRRTRNTLTHKYLRITNNKLDKYDKTLEELKNETIEIAILTKNAIIYLMRLVKIHEEHKEENLDIDFDFIEEFEDKY